MIPLALETAGSFVWRHWRWFVGGAVALGFALALFLARSDARHWHKAFDNEKALHALDIANYRAAAAEAAKRDAENVIRVKTEQDQITERVSHDYQVKLADSATRYDRLRAKASAYLGSPGETDVSATREATCLAVSGAACEDVPALLLEAQKNTDQLIALQAWVLAQSAVDVGNTP